MNLKRVVGLMNRLRTKSIAVARIKRAGFGLRRRLAALDDPKRDTATQLPTMLVALKVTNSDRLAIFTALLRLVTRNLDGGKVPVSIADASDEPFANEVKALAEGSGLAVRYEHKPEPMAVAFGDLLAGCETKYCYLQFDDMLTANLSTPFLAACCKMLDRYDPYVKVVSIPWATSAVVDHERRSIRVSAFEETDGPRYLFRDPPTQKPVFTCVVDGFTFGVFENFLYGFYFNNLVAPVSDFAERLAWYRRRLDTTSVHAIEMASARKSFGPIWTHLAICLDDVSILDIDFSHTEATVRAEESRNRAHFEAIRDDYDLETWHGSRGGSEVGS
jgi:hypothetical protein